jgi:dCTP deaminase
MEEPWKDWIPGVLNWTQMSELCKAGAIKGNDSLEGAIGKSAIDLSLSSKAFRMIQGSVKPFGPDFYDSFITKSKLGEQLEPFHDGTFTLNAKETYVFELNEKLNIKALQTAQIHGQATARSSVGRVDVLARLIVDGMETYEGFDPNSLKNYSGNMYLEITPITFSVRVKPNICLSQLRLFRGKPETAEIKGKELFMTALLISAK